MHDIAEPFGVINDLALSCGLLGLEHVRMAPPLLAGEVETEGVVGQNEQHEIMSALSNLQSELGALKDRDKTKPSNFFTQLTPVLISFAVSGLVAGLIFFGTIKTEIDDHSRRISVLEHDQMAVIAQLSDVREKIAGMAEKQSMGLTTLNHMNAQLNDFLSSHGKGK